MNAESDPVNERPAQSPAEPGYGPDPDAPPGVIEFGDGSEVVYAGDWRAEPAEDPSGIAEIVISAEPIGQAVFEAATSVAAAGGSFTVTLSTEYETTTFDDDAATMKSPAGPNDESLTVIPRDASARGDLIPRESEDDG
jgi:hypothetical protein